jgi:DNA-binding MarR family transcriptional regulator
MTNSENTPPIDENGKFITEGWTPKERPRFQFVREIRIIEEMRKATKDVPWMTLNHLMVLLYIFDMETPEGIEGQTLHKLTGLQKSTINRILHGFTDEGKGGSGPKKEGLGFIEMTSDPNDKRINRIHLTKDGKDLRDRLSKAGTNDDMDAAGVALTMETNILQSAERGAEPVIADKDLFEIDKRIGFYLQRAMKKALNENLNEVSYHSLLVPLLDTNDFKKEWADNLKILVGRKIHGYWMLFESGKLRESDFEYKGQPKFIMRDQTEAELTGMIKRAANVMVEGNIPVNRILSDLDTVLNTSQYNKVRNAIVHITADLRQHNINPAKKPSEAMLTLIRHRQRAEAKRLQAAAAMAHANSMPIASSGRMTFMREAHDALGEAVLNEKAAEEAGAKELVNAAEIITKQTNDEKIAQIERLLKEYKESKS